MAYNVSLCLAATLTAPSSAWATRLVTTMPPAAQASPQTRCAAELSTAASKGSAMTSRLATLVQALLQRMPSRVTSQQQAALSCGSRGALPVTLQ
ncbi:hypothetical protein V8C86DRAFT_2919101 [Haematococcus lacustris]